MTKMDPAELATVRATLIADYERDIDVLIAKHPTQAQNRAFHMGRLEGAEVVRFRRAVKTKFGQAFAKNELALAFPCEYPGSEYRTAWSFANAIGTSVSKNAFEVV